jgi:hypothetical protein
MPPPVDPLPPPIAVIELNTEFPPSVAENAPAPPAPTVTVNAEPVATAKPVAVSKPPAPPPPDAVVPLPPPPATTRYSTVVVTPLVNGLKVADM